MNPASILFVIVAIVGFVFSMFATVWLATKGKCDGKNKQECGKVWNGRTCVFDYASNTCKNVGYGNFTWYCAARKDIDKCVNQGIRCDWTGAKCVDVHDKDPMQAACIGGYLKPYAGRACIPAATACATYKDLSLCGAVSGCGWTGGSCKVAGASCDSGYELSNGSCVKSCSSYDSASLCPTPACTWTGASCANAGTACANPYVLSSASCVILSTSSAATLTCSVNSVLSAGACILCSTKTTSATCAAAGCTWHPVSVGVATAFCAST